MVFGSIAPQTPKLYRALSERYGLPLLSASEVMARIDPQLHANISRAYLSHEHIIPIKSDGKTVIVACRDPNSLLKFAYGLSDFAV